MQRCLRCIEGSSEGKVCPLVGQVTIGRGPENDIQIVDDQKLSRHHACVLERDDGQVVVQDLGSRNGTFLRPDKRQVSHAVLRVGDVFTVGDNAFVYEQVSDEDFAELASDSQVRFLSGPSVELTMTAKKRQAEAACSHPSHSGMNPRWRFCPSCGRELRG